MRGSKSLWNPHYCRQHAVLTRLLQMVSHVCGSRVIQSLGVAVCWFLNDEKQDDCGKACFNGGYFGIGFLFTISNNSETMIAIIKVMQVCTPTIGMLNVLHDVIKTTIY